MRGPQGARPRVLVALRVAGGQRFGHRCSGEFRGVAGPPQGELQRGTLRETLERRQTLQTDGERERMNDHDMKLHLLYSCMMILSETPHSSDDARLPSHLSVEDGLPGRPLLADRTLLHLLHRHLILSVQQLQASAHKHTHMLTHSALLINVFLCVAVCVSFTCFYQRQSSEPQMWFLPPP